MVLLAAGRSLRMGEPKLLLPWGHTSILGHLLQQWRGLGLTQFAAVVASQDPELALELDRLEFPPENRILNDHPECGMFHSIQQAARWPGWREDLTHWVVVLGDQPHLRSATLHGLLEFGANLPNTVCQPALAGRPRHPVLLPKRVFREVAQAKDDNLKQFLSGRSVTLWPCDDPGLDLDIDRPEDYERALALAFSARKDGSGPA